MLETKSAPELANEALLDPFERLEDCCPCEFWLGTTRRFYIGEG